MTQSRPLLAEYCAHGWALVPIPTGQKGPLTTGWNRRELCITDPEIAEWLDGNIGLAHAYSGTCAIDIDDLARSVTYLEQRGIDLAALLEAPDAVRIESRPGRAKLIYTIASPRISFKLGPLELRCASGSGLTLQDVLPPSIHPDTGKPYAWAYGSPAGHWGLAPPLPPELDAFWSSLIAVKAPKPTRAPVADRETLPVLRAVLETLDPDAPYDEWIGIGMAIHHETKGRPSGLALWNEWSSTGQKYRGLADLEAHWRSFRLDHENPRTLASFTRGAPASPDEFPRLPDPEPSAPPAAPEAGRREVLTGAARDKAIEALRGIKRSKQGTIEARISNVVSVLGVPRLCGHELALDDFLDSIMVCPEGTQEWRAFTDADYVTLRVILETVGGCDPIGHEMMRQAVSLVAETNRFDTAQLWLGGLQWDGTPRVETFCHRYFGTIDTPYERAVSRYLWTALAGRVIKPGCQADMVPVFIGRQGVGKSRGVQAMVPSPNQYVELRLDEPDDVIARKTRGILAAEFAELRGLRAADVERVKAFVTRTHERWVPKFKEFATNYPRRFLIIGTTNDEEFLPNDNEHRRWLPLHVDRVDVAAIRRDMEQLWAEGAVLFTAEGIAWQGIDALAKPAREAAAVTDTWTEAVAAWLEQNRAPHYRLADILSNALGVDNRVATRAHELRVGRILHSLGYVRTSKREGGRVVKVWIFDPTS